MAETRSSKRTEKKARGDAPVSGLQLNRVFTTEGVHPYDEVSWESRDVVMTNWRDGSINFEQRGVEFPSDWSVNATNIVTSKYFRGAVGSDKREKSLKQLIDRVIKTYTSAGVQYGYFATEKDAQIFSEELTYMLLHQYFSFNSPVWFNVGTPAKQQVSACFILSVDDDMESILNWYKEEGFIFKGGSGAGLNLSKIRSSKELLSSGGNASGPVSFMRGADASAGTIKSGGATRRAAKMVVLDVDHPDIEDFIETKAREEDKIRALRDAGFDMDLGGKDIISVQYQNANNSVRVSDEFMRAVEKGEEFGLRARIDGSVIDTVDARDLYTKMAQAAWECADPGVQYDDTINDWHTNPESGRITASNPCFPADQRVATDKGLIRIGDLVRRASEGETFGVYTNDITASTDPQDRVVATVPTQYMVTGTNEILELRFSDGSRLRCTSKHRIWTQNRGWVHADELSDSDEVIRSHNYAPRAHASVAVPERARVVARQHAERLNLPEKWDEMPDLSHFLGWLVGDGSLTQDAAVTVYGSAEEQSEVLPRHQRLLERLTGRTPKPSVQANGTQQLRSMRAGVRDYIAALGLSSKRAAEKVFPESMFGADEHTLVDFLQGLFDADGCAVETQNGTRYVGLGSKSEELLLGVQETLASLGIASRIYQHEKQNTRFEYTRKDGTAVEYASEGSFFDLRISGPSMMDFAALIGFSVPSKDEKLSAMLDNKKQYNTDRSVRCVSQRSVGFETTYNLTEPRNHSYIVSGVVVKNCSEYLSLDNSSCNLASLNLMKFQRKDGTFDADLFVKAVELVVTAMDISICFADFPTEKIGETTRSYRQLGVGYANLGALLMSTGRAYDSPEGNTLAAAITSLMTATGYRRSAEIAGIVGPYDGYARNAQAHQRVMRKHAAASDEVRPLSAEDGEVLERAAAEWTRGNEIGGTNGWRNAQMSVLAPTGTIGLMMDCDTTGIEPDLALVKFKKLVGGGSMQIVNQTVPAALRHLGYQEEQIEAIVEYIAEHGNVLDAPGLKPKHYSVFDCAIGEQAIEPMGHVRMMAAVQPFLSGAISKTVNMPESSTVDDVADIYMQGWKMGLKALAVYRDNCKVGQPLSASKSESDTAEKEASQNVVYRVQRQRLPKKRPAQTVSFTVSGAEGYLTSSSYPDDGIGEMFLKMSKQGSTLSGVMDAFSVAISIALQYGVPLETFVEKFTNMRFEPAGMTDDPDVRFASSVVDYVFRRLALDYLPYEKRAQLGIYSVEERTQQVNGTAKGDVELTQSAAPEAASETVREEIAPAAAEHDAPMCFTCGTTMRRAGACFVCEGCGSTSGCS